MSDNQDQKNTELIISKTHDLALKRSDLVKRGLALIDEFKKKSLVASEYLKHSQMNYHILCVDDEKLIGEAIVNWSRDNTNCRIAHVMDANEAFEYLENNRVDLVITNISMPSMDGLTMTNIITKKYPTKVIVLTGFGGMKKDEFRQGASAFVNKPCNLNDLFEVVYQVMKEDATFYPVSFALDEIDIKELTKHAENGNAEAQNHLGVMYYALGKDAPQNHAEAMKWFRKAADQGDV